MEKPWELADEEVIARHDRRVFFLPTATLGLRILIAVITVLFLLLIGLVACTGVVLLIDHWRTRTLHRSVRAYEGLGDGDWLPRPTLRENSRDDEGRARRKGPNPEG